MSDALLAFGLGAAAAAAGLFFYEKASLKIPSHQARSLAVQITGAASSGCSQISPDLVQAFQLALNPWLAGTFPALRTDGVLDEDTANWVDDLNTFYNGMHAAFACAPTLTA